MKYIQDNLPNFDKEYAIAQQKSIPEETRQEFLTRKYWQFRKYFDKTGDWKHHKRADMVAGFKLKQRER